MMIQVSYQFDQILILPHQGTTLKVPFLSFGVESYLLLHLVK